MKIKIIRVILNRESILESVVQDAVTFSLLLLSIYVSGESPFWTALTSVMFICFLYVVAVGEKKLTTFKTKKALLEWANALPDDDTGNVNER